MDDHSHAINEATLVLLHGVAAQEGCRLLENRVYADILALIGTGLLASMVTAAMRIPFHASALLPFCVVVGVASVCCYARALLYYARSRGLDRPMIERPDARRQFPCEGGQFAALPPVVAAEHPIEFEHANYAMMEESMVLSYRTHACNKPDFCRCDICQEVRSLNPYYDSVDWRYLK